MERRPRGRKPILSERAARIVLAAVLVVLAFLLGMAFADTLDERPRPGGVVTDVRTLAPIPQEQPAETVTVTVTSP
jgi:hypothetical protein